MLYKYTPVTGNMTEVKYRQDVALILSGTFSGLSDAHDDANSGLCNQGTVPTHYWTIDTNDASVSTLSRPHITTGNTKWCQIKTFTSGYASVQVLENGTDGTLTNPRYQSTSSSLTYQSNVDFYNTTTYISVTDRVTAIIGTDANLGTSAILDLSSTTPHLEETSVSNVGILKTKDLCICYAGTSDRNPYYRTTYASGNSKYGEGEHPYNMASRPAFGPGGTATPIYAAEFKFDFAPAGRKPSYSCPSVYIIHKPSSEADIGYATIQGDLCVVAVHNRGRLAWKI